ncbi:MAG: ATP-binding protein [Lachnospiraceae bacterium]|nr:ATP-binding protein [Lachnospiraceae bacterium]
MALKNAQYDSIMKSYERTRDYNRELSENRRRAIYEALPDYARLDASVAELSVSIAKQMLSGDEAASQRLKGLLQDISVQKKELLAANGYPADYLDPIYECRDCRDTGYIETPDGLREKCHCFRNQEISLLYEQSNIRDMLSTENFSTLSYQYYQGEDLERFQKAVDICKNFVQNFKHDYHNLFFYGTVGTGKSFLSGCVANELLHRGCTAIYFSSQGLFETLARYSFEEKSKEALYNFYDDLYNSDLVIIDDLGTELTNSFVTSQLFSCLNERHLRKKATIISTNLSLEELHNRYSDRIFSRIINQFELCKLTGPDIRMLKKRNMSF